MAVTGWKSPGTLANVDYSSGNEWDSPGNAASSNDAWASKLLKAGEHTDYLRATNFGFTSGDIPANAVIDGIEVEVERHAIEVGTVADCVVILRKTSGQVGSNKASGSYWPTSDAYAAYGGAADTWSAGLVDTDIKSSDFGLDFAAINEGFPYVDHIRIRVYYTESGLTVAPSGYDQAIGYGTPTIGFVTPTLPQPTRKVLITHAAIKSVSVYKDGTLVTSYGNLSNLDEQRIESGIEIPVTPPVTIEVTTITNRLWTFDIPP